MDRRLCPDPTNAPSESTKFMDRPRRFLSLSKVALLFTPRLSTLFDLLMASSCWLLVNDPHNDPPLNTQNGGGSEARICRKISDLFCIYCLYPPAQQSATYASTEQDLRSVSQYYTGLHRSTPMHKNGSVGEIRLARERLRKQFMHECTIRLAMLRARNGHNFSRRLEMSSWSPACSSFWW